jgi:hypothetical protein
MLGGQSGGLVPAAFTTIEVVAESPLYGFGAGLAIAVIFAWILGFGATLAEPALNALGLTVETLSNGAFRKSALMVAVSVGVAFGIAAGVLKIVFAIPIVYLVVPGYAIAVLLTAMSSEGFVNIAWDSAGVTTGPVTVPLVLAMGLGVLGVAVEVEKAVVNIVVANDQVDRVFERMYLAGKLDTPGRGMMYVTPLEKAATYIPSDILAKLEREGQVKDV